MSLNEFLKESLGLAAIVLNSNKLAMDYAATGQFETAMLLLQRANEMLHQDSRPGYDIKLKAITLNNIGCVYKRMGLFDKALSFLTEALNFQECLESDTLSLASTHLNLCAIYSHLTQHENALVHVMRALSVLRQEKELSTNQAVTLVIAFNNAAVEYEFLAEYEEARNLYYEGWEHAVENLGRDHELSLKLLEAFQQLAQPKARTDSYHTSKLRTSRSPKATPVRAPATDLVTFFESQNFRRRRVKVGRTQQPAIPEEPARSISNIRDYQQATPTVGPRSRLTPMRQAPTPRLPQLAAGKPPVRIERTMVLLGEQMEFLRDKMTRFEQSMGSADTRELTSRQQIAFFSRRRQQAAVKIQRQYRRFKAKKRATAKKQAVVTVQCWFRIVLSKGVVAQRRASRHMGLVKILAWVRMWICKHAVREDLAVLRVQAWTRMCIYKHQVREDLSILKVQAWVRMRIYKREIRQDLVVRRVQQMFRAWDATQQVALAKRNLTFIQRTFKAFLCKCQLLHVKTTVHFQMQQVQCIFQRFQAMQVYLQVRAQTEQVALVLQKALRTVYSKERVCQARDLLTECQILIAQGLRRKYCWDIVHTERTRLDLACAVIQAKFREFIKKRDVGKSLRVYRYVTQFLQKLYRGRKARTVFATVKTQTRLSSVTIQSVFRAWMDKQRYLHTKSTQFEAAAVVQLALRRLFSVYEVKTTRQRLNNIACLIQTNFRAMIVRIETRNVLLAEKRSSLQIQRIRRGYTARRTFKQYTLTLASNALRIQRILRRFIAVSSFKATKYLRSSSALLIQKTFRMFKVRRQYLQKRAAAKEIKKVYLERKHRHQQETRIVDDFLSSIHSLNALLTQPRFHHSPVAEVPAPKTPPMSSGKKRKISLIQSTIRAFNHRRQFIKNTSSDKIKAAFKTYKFRQGFQLSRQVKLIQASFRAFVVRAQYPEIRLWPSVIKIQAMARAFLVRDAGFPVTGVMKIQALVRSFVTRRGVRLELGVLAIQQFVRMLVIRKKYRRQISILKIQTKYRTFFERSRLHKYRQIVRMQCALRQFFALQLTRVERLSLELARNLQEEEETRTRRRFEAALVIQKHYRRYLSQQGFRTLQIAATVIQKNWRMAKIRSIFLGVRNAAVFIQDFYRYTRLKRRFSAEPGLYFSQRSNLFVY